MKKQTSRWDWYGVKLIYECSVSGQPETEKNTDVSDCKYCEESMMLVHAQSFDHAYSIAKKKALEVEMDYVNPWGQLVRWRFSQTIDCYLIGEAPRSGTEVYSRTLKVPADMGLEDFLDRYYPDTMPVNSGPNKALLNREFSRKTNCEI